MEQCQGITGSGSRCKRLIPIGQNFCFQHQKQSQKDVKRKSPVKKSSTKVTKKPTAKKLSPTKVSKKLTAKKVSPTKITKKPVAKKSAAKKISSPPKEKRSPSTYIDVLPMNIIQEMLRNIKITDYPTFCASNPAILKTCRRVDTIGHYLTKLGLTDRLMYLYLSGTVGSEEMIEGATPIELAIICAGAVEGNQVQIIENYAINTYRALKNNKILRPKDFLAALIISAIRYDRGKIFVYLVEYAIVAGSMDKVWLSNIVTRGKVNCLEESIKSPAILRLLKQISSIYETGVISGNPTIIALLLEADIAIKAPSIILGYLLRYADLEILKIIINSNQFITILAEAEKYKTGSYSVELLKMYNTVLLIYAAYYNDEDLYSRLITEHFDPKSKKKVKIWLKSYKPPIEEIYASTALYFAAFNSNKKMYDDIVDRFLPAYLKHLKKEYKKGSEDAPNEILDELYRYVDGADRVDLIFIFNKIAAGFVHLPLVIYHRGFAPVINLPYVRNALRKEKYDDIVTLLTTQTMVGRREIIDEITLYAGENNNLELIEQIETLYPDNISYDKLLTYGARHFEVVVYALEHGADIDAIKVLPSHISLYSFMLLIKKGYKLPDISLSDFVSLKKEDFSDMAVYIYVQNHIDAQEATEK